MQLEKMQTFFQFFNCEFLLLFVNKHQLTEPFNKIAIISAEEEVEVGNLAY